MTHLSEKRCRVVDQDEEAMDGDDLTHYMAQLDSDWKVVDGSYLARIFHFPKHGEALELVNDISDVAMKEEHYPDLMLSYGELKVRMTTSEVEGLHENDFIMAAKIDRLSD